ncbi:multiheme c-type cytochrome [Sulfurimonas sp.]|uniref:multiheme c-type cytochrome n=1 Tax=Sulfurimonas sp. TaxID=2022749 RepID=UPI0039E5D081
MKSLFIIVGVMTSTLAFAVMHFEKNQKCSECHPKIYEEYKTSQHGNSTVFADPIHGAVYDKHPMKNKMQKYRCAKCHTPTADNMKDLLTPKNGVIPDATNETQNEGVSCAYCHRITDTKPGKAMNSNVISKDMRKYFANLESDVKSPFHEIETNVEVFKNGKLCMGCHMHKTNKKGFDVCSTENNNMDGNNNCITCHMPQVDGAPSTLSKVKKHAFHGFPGLHGDLSLLSKYVVLDLKHSKKKFTVSVDHQATHSSTLHPLRMAKLVVSIKRDGKVIKMDSKKLLKVIGNAQGVSPKPTPPWLADRVIKDTRIPANTKKDFKYDFALKKGDLVTVKFGYHLVKPKALKKFKLENNKNAKEFKVISKKVVRIK